MSLRSARLDRIIRARLTTILTNQPFIYYRCVGIKTKIVNEKYQHIEGRQTAVFRKYIVFGLIVKENLDFTLVDLSHDISLLLSIKRCVFSLLDSNMTIEQIAGHTCALLQLPLMPTCIEVK